MIMSFVATDLRIRQNSGKSRYDVNSMGLDEKWKFLLPYLDDPFVEHCVELIFWSAVQARFFGVPFESWFKPEKYPFPASLIETRPPLKHERAWYSAITCTAWGSHLQVMEKGKWPNVLSEADPPAPELLKDSGKSCPVYPYKYGFVSGKTSDYFKGCEAWRVYLTCQDHRLWQKLRENLVELRVIRVWFLLWYLLRWCHEKVISECNYRVDDSVYQAFD